ncbi:MAG TPA: hypothetical protein VLM89_09990 [Phycisphaerae bacterium]|nr:hypothetical protein [Phycisphaerae bacterium]
MADPGRPESTSTPRGLGMAGLAVIGGMITGFAGLVLALVTSARDGAGAAGMCLIAAALAFGLLANAFFRR